MDENSRVGRTEKGDTDEVTIKTKDNPPAMVTVMRRMSRHDLRAEVLTLIAKRDRALFEELFARIKSESDSAKEKSEPFQRIGGDNFNLANVFRALAKDDLYRAVEVAKTFKHEAPRANRDACHCERHPRKTKVDRITRLTGLTR